MIFVDDRVGSRELLAPLKKLGVPAELTRLESGDVAIVGNGPDKGTVMVGIEVKKLDEFMSSVVDQRFAGFQLPALVASYDVAYLVIEGQFRPSPEDGRLLVFHHGKWSEPRRSKTWFYRDIDHYLTTLENRMGVRVRISGGKTETTYLLKDIYTWWTASEFEEHRSHMAVYHVGSKGDVRLQTLSPIERQIQLTVSTLPGVGYELALRAAKHFPSVGDAMLSGVDEWQKIDGIGRTKAQAIVKAITTRRQPTRESAMATA